MRKYLLSAAFAAATLLGSYGPGWAITIDLGIISGDVDLNVGRQGLSPLSSFSDNYTFTLDPNAFTTSASVTITPQQNINPLAISLFTSANVQVGSTVTGGGLGPLFVSFPTTLLGPGGSFYYLITGTLVGATQAYGGVASFRLAEVPLPGALLLMGSALLGAAGFKRWRKRVA